MPAPNKLLGFEPSPPNVAGAWPDDDTWPNEELADVAGTLPNGLGLVEGAPALVPNRLRCVFSLSEDFGAKRLLVVPLVVVGPKLNGADLGGSDILTFKSCNSISHLIVQRTKACRLTSPTYRRQFSTRRLFDDNCRGLSSPAEYGYGKPEIFRVPGKTRHKQAHRRFLSAECVG